jgi:hypothetical protein
MATKQSAVGSNKQSAAKLSKREKFEEAGRFPVKKVSIIAAAVIVIAVGGFLGYHFATAAPEVGGAVVEQGGADYSGGQVAMTVLPQATVEAGSLKIPVDEIKAKKIVGVLYSRTTPMPDGYNDIANNGLPVLAYVAPSGRLVVASSLCEPCHSYEFHIEGNDLVCNSCYTHWDLNTLEGKSGGCQAYPPLELKTVVQGASVDVPTDVLESWVPRA